jgi:hypothetical protein
MWGGAAKEPLGASAWPSRHALQHLRGDSSADDAPRLYGTSRGSMSLHKSIGVAQPLGIELNADGLTTARSTGSIGSSTRSHGRTRSSSVAEPSAESPNSPQLCRTAWQWLEATRGRGRTASTASGWCGCQRWTAVRPMAASRCERPNQSMDWVSVASRSDRPSSMVIVC